MPEGGTFFGPVGHVHVLDERPTIDDVLRGSIKMGASRVWDLSGLILVGQNARKGPARTIFVEERGLGLRITLDIRYESGSRVHGSLRRAASDTLSPRRDLNQKGDRHSWPAPGGPQHKTRTSGDLTQGEVKQGALISGGRWGSRRVVRPGTVSGKIRKKIMQRRFDWRKRVARCKGARKTRSAVRANWEGAYEIARSRRTTSSTGHHGRPTAERRQPATGLSMRQHHHRVLAG